MTSIDPAIYLASAKPALDAWAPGHGWVFLFQDALSLLPHVRQTFPAARIAVREWIDPDQPALLNQGNVEASGYAYGQGFINRYPDADGYQSWNEAEHQAPMGNLIAFDRGFLRACEDQGKTAILGTFSDYWSGLWPPSGEVWAQWMALLNHPNAAMGLHIYWAPEGPGVTMYDFRSHLPPRWFVMECGIRGGWRNQVDPQTYMAQLAAFRDQHAPDAEAIFPFLAGDSGGWANFDLAGTAIPAALGQGSAVALPAVGRWLLAHWQPVALAALALVIVTTPRRREWWER